MKIKLTFIEGMIIGLNIMALWIIAHYGLGFEFQGIDHGFRIWTLFDLSIMTIILYRLTNLNLVETSFYALIQYVFYDTVWSYGWMSTPLTETFLMQGYLSHYLILYICCIGLACYYKLFHIAPSFKLKYLLVVLVIIGFPIYYSVKIGWNTSPPVSHNDELFKWLMLPCFVFSSKKLEPYYRKLTGRT